MSIVMFRREMCLMMADKAGGDRKHGLRGLAAGKAPCLPMLPLTHMTGAGDFQQIRAAESLAVTQCPDYNEPLLYLFYGRPAYRPFPDEGPSWINDLRPVCVLLRPDALKQVARIAVVDTGALHRGLYKRHLGPAVRREDFELGEDLGEAASFVGAVFGSNLAYYLGRARNDLQAGPLDFAAQAYRSIITDRARAESDGRRATIEVHSSADIPLGKDTVLAVALPEEFLQDDKVLNLLKHCECDVIPYDLYGDSPSSDSREVMVRVKAYLQDRGYFHA
jgi:hypothetical protein